MRLRRKCKSRAGFTLAETMLAVLILLLVSSIVIAGIPAAKNAYEKVVLGANAQALLSTTVTALRGELGTAWNVQQASGTAITYFSADTGFKSQIDVEGQQIKILEYAEVAELGINYTGEAGNGNEHPLVPAAAAAGDMYITYDGVAYDADTGVVEFTGLAVRSTIDDHVLASLSKEGASALRIQVFSTGADTLSTTAADADTDE